MQCAALSNIEAQKMAQVKGIKKNSAIAYAPYDAPDPFGNAYALIQCEMGRSPADSLVEHVADATLVAALHCGKDSGIAPTNFLPLISPIF
jgi:hypothetical protein